MPADRKKRERQIKVKEMTCGDWRGYTVEGLHLTYGFFSNGKLLIRVDQSLEKQKGRMSVATLPKIIAAVEVL